MRKWIDLVEGQTGNLEVEFVCVHHYDAPRNTTPEAAKRLWERLKTIPNLCIYRQDFIEEANHEAMCAIIRVDDDETLRHVKEAARECGVEIDVIDRNNHLIDIERGMMDNLAEVHFTDGLYESAQMLASAGNITLYHVAPSHARDSIQKDGIRPVSYWSCREEIANYYAETIKDDGDTPVTYEVALSKLDPTLIEPDYEGIEEPLTHTLKMSEDEVWDEWSGSDQTWQDCLEIIGSIRYQGWVKDAKEIGLHESADVDGHALHVFKFGGCGALAIALHDLTGWPIVAITDAHNVYDGQAGGGSAMHWSVRHPSGKLLDIDGLHDPDELTSEYHYDADDDEAAWGISSRESALEWYEEAGSEVSMNDARTYAQKLLDGLSLNESFDPRCRDVSAYILAADPAERRETLTDILKIAKIDGFGGRCFIAAYTINEVLFGGKGELVACFNGPMMDREARFLGHITVRFGDEYWDADGDPKPLEDIESWGMLDPTDPDFDLTEKEAYQVRTKVFEPETVLNMARMRGDNPEHWENALLRAVGEVFEFDEPL